MYISLISLKAGDSYSQHQAIWTLFPDFPEGERDHLFRIEGEQQGWCTALLQSVNPPRTSAAAKVLQSKPFKLHLTNGDHLKFKLVAQPTKRLYESRNIIELETEPEQLAWLKRKLQGANVTVTLMTTHIAINKKGYASRFVTFAGILAVIDAAAVTQYVVKGVGRQKHAGAGLLSLARAS